jgi:hypothetical protein
MGAMNWLNRLRKNESGNILVIAAAAMPMVMGAAGLAVDTVQLALWKRQLQRAADSAAIAGAHAMVQGASTDAAVANDLDEHVDFDSTRTDIPVVTDANVRPGSFADGTISDRSCADRGVSPCYGRAVQVSLTSERRLPFIGIFSRAPNVLTADGTAAIVGRGDFCMISLYNGNQPGIDAGGNPELDLSCGIATNSRAGTNAINIYGTAGVLASPLSAVGGIKPGKNSYKAQVMQPFSDSVADPYADVPDPVAPSTCDKKQALEVKNGDVVKLDQANNCFTSWDINGSVELAPGTYFVDGGKFDLKGSIKGEGVTIVLLGDNSTLIQNGGGTLDITAPESGDLEGIALYRDRTAANDATKPIKINGGAELKVKGAIYMPSTDIWVGGNADFDTECLQVIGRILTFKGGGKVRNECDDTNVKTTARPTIRLVE